jgi:hypothetical protein
VAALMLLKGKGGINISFYCGFLVQHVLPLERHKNCFTALKLISTFLSSATERDS